MCTRVFWSDNRLAKVVSRTMDWAVSDDPVLWAAHLLYLGTAGFAPPGAPGAISNLLWTPAALTY
jgi:hypothetical protein